MPYFIEKCVCFIEEEGLSTEGLYRVPGNQVHVVLLTDKFKEGGCHSSLHNQTHGFVSIFLIDCLHLGCQSFRYSLTPWPLKKNDMSVFF